MFGFKSHERYLRLENKVSALESNIISLLQKVQSQEKEIKLMESSNRVICINIYSTINYGKEYEVLNKTKPYEYYYFAQTYDYNLARNFLIDKKYVMAEYHSDGYEVWIPVDKWNKTEAT